MLNAQYAGHGLTCIFKMTNSTLMRGVVEMVRIITTVLSRKAGSKNMKQLLNSKNLLAEKRVVAAYKALVNRSPGYCSHQPASSYCDVCGVPGSLADVAFEMRDAVSSREWLLQMYALYTYAIDLPARYYDVWFKTEPTAEQWIIATTLAWEAKQ